MTCPNEDKLLAYVDRFLDEEETKQIEQHTKSCTICADKVTEMENENSLLMETFKSPGLPDNFAETIVAQVTTYKSKRKRFWKWGIGTAASVLLAGGILFTNPSFADFIGGIFLSDRVDEGIQLAMDTDIATPVDLAVTDAGITLHVEHLIADTSRIAFSYKVTDSKGKKLNPFFNEDREQYAIKLLDENKQQVELTGWSWVNTDNYGIFELSLVDVENFTKGMIQINVTEIARKTGNWFIEFPVDLTAALENQQVVDIGEKIEADGIEVTLKQVSYATSTTDISYTTEYTDETKQELKTAIKEKEKQFNTGIVHSFFPYHPTIGYRIENENGEVLGYHNIFGREDRGHPVTLNMLSGRGSGDSSPEELGAVSWNDSFVPEKEVDELYFVLDTIYKTKTTDFSVTFKPDDLPYTFEYNGYELTIDSINRKTDYSLTKSWFPIDRQVMVELHMSGYAEQTAPELAVWAIEDNFSNNYFTFNSGSSILDDTDRHGRFKREIQLISYDLKEIPEEITLHLIAEIEAIKLENEWRVPLFNR